MLVNNYRLIIHLLSVIAVLALLLTAVQTPIYAQSSKTYSVVDSIGWKSGYSVPASVTETYSYNPSTDTLTVTVAFSSQGFAALPPMLALAYDQGFPITFDNPPQNTGQHSVFGPLMGYPNSTGYTYHITGLGKYVNLNLNQPTSNQVPPLIQQKLEQEVQKIIEAGLLAPAPFHVKSPGQGSNPQAPVLMWYHPSEQLYLLAEILPLLSPSLQSNLKTYLTQARNQYPPETVSFIPPTQGTRRGYFPMPDNALALYDGAFKYQSPTLWNLYGLSRYYSAVNQTPTQSQMTAISAVANNATADLDWATFYWKKGYQPTFNAVHGANQAFSGSIGYIRLAQLSGNSSSENYGWGMLGRFAALRYAMTKYTQYQQEYGYWVMPSNPTWWVTQHIQEKFTYNTHLQWIGELVTWDWSRPIDNVRQVHRLDETGIDVWDWFSDHNAGNEGVAKNTNQKEPYARPGMQYAQNMPRYIGIADLTPESAIFLRDYAHQEIQAYYNRIHQNWPLWHIAFTSNAVAVEAGLAMPYLAHDLFMTKTWILQADPADLAKKIDVPWTPKVGDYYYIHKLSETAKAYHGWYQDGGIDPHPADRNADGVVNIFDLNQVITQISTLGYSVYQSVITFFGKVL